MQTISVVRSTSPVIVVACKPPNYAYDKCAYKVYIYIYIYIYVIIYMFLCYVVPSKCDDIGARLTALSVYSGYMNMWAIRHVARGGSGGSIEPPSQIEGPLFY